MKPSGSTTITLQRTDTSPPNRHKHSVQIKGRIVSFVKNAPFLSLRRCREVPLSCKSLFMSTITHERGDVGSVDTRASTKNLG